MYNVKEIVFYFVAILKWCIFLGNFVSDYVVNSFRRHLFSPARFFVYYIKKKKKAGGGKHYKLKTTLFFIRYSYPFYSLIRQVVQRRTPIVWVYEVCIHTRYTSYTFYTRPKRSGLNIDRHTQFV